jgi:hypothetical protein
MRLHGLGISALVLSLHCATASVGPLDSVLIRHAQSRGGAERIEAIRAMKTTLRVEEPKFKVEVHYAADRTGRLRVDVYAEGKRVFSEGIDERGAWSMGGSAPPKEASAQGAAALEHGRLFNLYALHELPRLGHRIVLQRRETVRGSVYDVLRLEMADGFKTWRFLDAENGRMVLQRDYRAIHPDLDPRPVWIESLFYDFRAVGGVVFPLASKQYELETGEWMQTTQILSMELNPPLTGEELRRPE